MIAKYRLSQAVAGIARMALIALALVAIAGPAPAEQKEPPEPSAAAMKLAREIIDLKGSAALFSPLVAGVIERVKFIHLQTNPGLRKELEEVALSLRKQFAPRTAEIITEVARSYASAFTEPELKQILAFYRTPIGKKVIAVEPQVMEDALAGVKPWQDAFGEEVLSHFRTEMKKRGHSL